MDISERLVRIMKSNFGGRLDSISELIDYGADFLDEKLSEWEKSLGMDSETKSERQSSNTEQAYENTKTSSQSGQNKPKSDPLAEDLRLFGLKPPSSLEEVRQARNREIKKYHPDKWVNEPDKRDVAKEIMQIYNTAYERLKKSFDKRG